MKMAAILVLMSACCLASAGDTNNVSVTLSGLLYMSKPMVHLAPYYLDVTVVGNPVCAFDT